MVSFHQMISSAHPAPGDIAARQWIYVPYDRFTDATGPIAEHPASQTGLIFVESTTKPNRRPYHKKKLVLLISNMRHFALEQAVRGVKVLYHQADEPHGMALLTVQRQHGFPRITVMRPAERELRLDLAQAVAAGLQLTEVPDATWLSTTEDFVTTYGPYKVGKSYVMDRFYRRMRQQTGILMANAKPVGGQFSFDANNRNAYKGQVPIPTPPNFPPDDITQEVIALVEQHYPHHFGTTAGFDLPTTSTDCDATWQFALHHLLPTFGPYEDAMRDDHLQLFHSRTSALINLGRLLPTNLIRDVEDAANEGLIPLSSAEGFIRQLLGWREFMRHIHDQTDGYRALSPTAHTADAYAGATPNALSATLPLPAVYWGVASGLRCIDTVVAQVVQEGWSHHITRLMVLSNLATLCGFSPRELTDWFWFAYVDAYDWVVEPNVLGMATYADGGITATKPYVSGAAYINKMSNYCGHCRYDPKKSVTEDACPFTALYWTFLERNQERLGNNFRLQMPYNALRKKSQGDLVQLRARAEEAIVHLQSFSRPGYEAANSTTLK